MHKAIARYLGESDNPRMKIVFFDGYCSLCNGLVDWLIRHDQSGEVKFASLQGQTAQNSLPEKLRHDLDTIVYARENKVLLRSTAVLWIIADLGGLWSLASLLLLIPEPVRDSIYQFIATNRYRVFGKRDTCRVPTPEEKARLLS